MYPLNLQTKEVLGRYSTSDLDIHPAISHSSPALFNRNRKRATNAILNFLVAMLKLGKHEYFFHPARVRSFHRRSDATTPLLQILQWLSILPINKARL